MADTLVNTLYPPMLDTFQPAFVYTDDALVTFSLSPFNAGTDIKYIHVSVVDQRNNENVLKGYKSFLTTVGGTTTELVDYGIINGLLVSRFKNGETDPEKMPSLIKYDKDNDLYILHISPDFLRKEDTVPSISQNSETEEGSSSETKVHYFNIGQYYKVQIRFDTGEYLDIEATTQRINEISDGNERQELSGKLNNYMVDARPYFSEWSEITLVKPILPLQVAFAKFDSVTSDDEEESIVEFNKGLIRIVTRVLFSDTARAMAVLKENQENILFNGAWDETEHLERYRIRVYQSNINGEKKADKPLHDSDMIYAQPTRVSLDETYEYGINYLLDMHNGIAEQYYLLEVDIWSNNEYHKQFHRVFRISNFLDITQKPKWNNRVEERYNTPEGKKDIEVNQEDGVVKINFSWIKASRNGTLHIKRSCSKDNFKHWDIIYQKSFIDTELIEVSFEDYTVCSLYAYKYCAQFEPSDGTDWSNIEVSNEVYPQFYEMLLERQNRQIAIRYDGKISALKPIVNRQKVDTLGGKYPKFVENAQMNYKQLSIQGVISAEGDHNRKFLNEFDGEWLPLEEGQLEENREYEYYYKDMVEKFNEKSIDSTSGYMVRNDTAADGEFGYNPKKKNSVENPQEYRADDYADYTKGLFYDPVNTQSISTYSRSIFSDVNVDSQNIDYNYYIHDLYPTNNWYWEREFREQLTAWLNDGEPKLFRSMPEGNIAVILTDINLTPNQSDRLRYNFSATMYEVGDGYSLEELDKLGIINIPKVAIEYNSDYDSDNADIDDDDEDEVIGTVEMVPFQLYLPQIVGDIVTGSIDELDQPNQWDSLSIKERLAYQHAPGTFLANIETNNLFLRDVKIQFVSLPQYYKYEGDEGTGARFSLVTPSSHENDESSEEENYFFGYTVDISHAVNSSRFSTQFFVNDRGYFQLPSNSLVNGLRFKDLEYAGHDAIIDGILEYTISTNNDTSVKRKRTLRKIIGQYGNTFPANEYIGDYIFDRHRKIEYNIGQENSNPSQMPIKSIEELEYWQGVCLDVTPYSLVGIKYVGEQEAQIILVGRSGILSLLDDTPIENISFLGRKMFKTTEERIPYLDEWECYIDAKEGSSSGEFSTLNWNAFVENAIWQETDIPVQVYTYQNISDDYPVGEESGIFSEWLDVNDWNAKDDFPTNPQINVVYKIRKNENDSMDYIYYIDHKWYPVDILNDGSVRAHVPVYGYVNYTGNIVRSDY